MSRAHSRRRPRILRRTFDLTLDNLENVEIVLANGGMVECNPATDSAMLVYGLAC